MRKPQKSKNPLYDIFYGGDSYRNMLVKYFEDDRAQLVELVQFHMQNRRQVIEFMGGQELYDYLPEREREPMFVLSVMRFLCEELGVWKPKTFSENTEKFSATAPIEHELHAVPTGPVTYGA